LFLDVNKIGDDGATALAKALQVNSDIEMINLNFGNKIGDDGAIAFQEALQVNGLLSSHR
jgi:hypothetical protein